jgi:hypothetical protein
VLADGGAVLADGGAVLGILAVRSSAGPALFGGVFVAGPWWILRVWLS